MASERKRGHSTFFGRDVADLSIFRYCGYLRHCYGRVSNKVECPLFRGRLRAKGLPLPFCPVGEAAGPCSRGAGPRKRGHSTFFGRDVDDLSIFRYCSYLRHCYGRVNKVECPLFRPSTRWQEGVWGVEARRADPPRGNAARGKRQAAAADRPLARQRGGGRGAREYGPQFW